MRPHAVYPEALQAWVHEADSASSIGRHSFVRWNGEVTFIRRISSKPFLGFEGTYLPSDPQLLMLLTCPEAAHAEKVLNVVVVKRFAPGLKG